MKTLIARYPGATVSLLARKAGLSSTAARHAAAELVDAGEATRVGPGGGAGRQLAFYPVDT